MRIYSMRSLPKDFDINIELIKGLSRKVLKREQSVKCAKLSFLMYSELIRNNCDRFLTEFTITEENCLLV